MKTLSDLHDDARAAQVRVSRLLDLMGQAQAIQWQAPPRKARPSYDTTERASSTAPNDPTADVALDERRLDVRAAVERARFFLERQQPADLDALVIELEQAIQAWEGDPEPGE